MNNITFEKSRVFLRFFALLDQTFVELFVALVLISAALVITHLMLITTQSHLFDRKICLFDLILKKCLTLIFL